MIEYGINKLLSSSTVLIGYYGTTIHFGLTSTFSSWKSELSYFHLLLDDVVDVEVTTRREVEVGLTLNALLKVVAVWVKGTTISSF